MRAPLADRIRPKTIDDMVGQPHLLGEGKALRTIIQSGELPNLTALQNIFKIFVLCVARY